MPSTGKRRLNSANHVRIRDYRSQDFNPLWQLDQQCFPPGVAYTRFELMSYIRSPGAFTLVAEQRAEGGGEPLRLGFLVAERGANPRRPLAGEGKRGHIITLDIVAEVRRRGIASLLMDEAERRLLAAECSVCYLEVEVTNDAALAFYQRRGYRQLSTIPGYYGKGRDALVMARNLRGA